MTYGGVIVIGYPLSGFAAHILTTPLHEIGRCQDVGQGLATMCISVGQRIAMVVEKVV